MKVVVLGASGMLGSMTVDCLSRDRSLSLTATVRSAEVAHEFGGVCSEAKWRVLDVDGAEEDALLAVIGGSQWVVNCIGVIKPYIHEDNSSEIARAIRVNALFPRRLARAAEMCGSRVLQIATDCVFSGAKGRYLEQDPHDALDVYGKTKSLGEARSSHVHHLRASIIGPEPQGHVSLLDWFLNQPAGSTVQGYSNHEWNGITTLHFARLCHGVIRGCTSLESLQHLVPEGIVCKAELLHCCAESFGRRDIRMVLLEAPVAVDRTLATADPGRNRRLWAAAGYPQPPSIAQMLAELAEFDYRFGRVACAHAGA